MTEHVIDLAAASRISRRVDLSAIRLVEIHATSVFDTTARMPLTPTYDHDCVPTRVDAEVIEVLCKYKFKVRSSDTELAEANMTYQVTYKLIGDEPTAPSDVEHFARANGAYHTWPFVRETIFSLTSKLGFPPYTLPVLSFMPRPKPPALPTVSEPTTTAASDQSSPK